MAYSPLDKPDSIPRVFVEAWNNRDAAKIATLFMEDAEFINVTGLWWHNQADIEKAHAYGLNTIFKDSTLSIIRLKVKLLTESFAVVHAKMKLTGQTATDGVQLAGRRTNIFTFVVQKSAKEWLCVAAQNTDIVPGMETHVRDEQGKLKAVNYGKSQPAKD